ncbi:MAG: AAA family ATPase [Synergistaceae bacterium]|nr:AAA family ATPase [Synergistaceae bacterium]
MLERLSIRNVGGIGRCEISFEKGFTVITGESGAGKSSIVRAIELVSGKRGQSALIRAGEEEATVDAVFQTDCRLPDLEEEQQPAEGAFFVKRNLSRNGRGRASLQGNQVPVALYASSLSRLIHIQSQFAQLELLDAGRQLAMVDSCGRPELLAALSELRDVFERARVKERELRDITARREEIEQRYSNAAEVVPLVKKVNPTAGLEASLENGIAELSRQLADIEKIAQALDRLTGGRSEQGLLDALSNVGGTLTECLPPEDGEEAARLLREGLQSFQDIAAIARRRTGSPEALSQEIEALERRLGALRKLKRLAGAKSEEGLLDYCRGATEGLAWLEESYDRMEKTAREARELRRYASQTALTLRGERTRAAENLEERVNALFKDLAMDGIGFAIHFVELPKLRRDGADGMEFTLFTDKRSGKVDKIASGGELSRLLLALQLSLSDEWLPPTLVFDEVEAGLGGRAAVLSGLKLQELSRRCQVLLVTHEASIAALGDRHLVARKQDGESHIYRVEGEERVQEVARMLSGDPHLPEAREHARRLLQSPI